MENTKKKFKSGDLPQRVLVQRAMKFNCPSVNSHPSLTEYLTATCESGKITRFDPEMEAVRDVGIQEALSNHVVLSRIFMHLRVKDLLRCRQVNRTWDEIASTVLRQLNVCVFNHKLLQGREHIITFGIEGQAREILAPIRVLTKVERGSTQNFKALTNCIRVSRKFPCTGIELKARPWSVSNVEVKKFFKFYGQHIKLLKIDYAFQTVHSLRQILQVSAPNMEKLVLVNVGNFSRQIDVIYSLNPSTMSLWLPSLKIIDFCPRVEKIWSSRLLAWFSVCRGLILAAPNLERIDNFNSSLTEAVVQANKIHTITSYTLTAEPKEPESLLYFARAAPKLHTLKIASFISAWDTTTYNGFCQALVNLLKSSQNSLKTLQMEPLGILMNYQLPELPNLKNLEICQDVHFIDRFSSVPSHLRAKHFCFFPPEQSLAQTFTSLNKFRLKLSLVYDRIDEYLPSTGENTVNDHNRKLLTVKIMELSCRLDSTVILTLSHMFPNVTSLVLDWLKFQKHKPHCIWTFSLPLKKIELYSFSFLWEKGSEPGTAMDNFFTGIPEPICKNLQQRDKLLHVDADIFRTEPSICSFKDLQELKIRFNFDGLLGLRLLNAHCPLISKVTGWYAFELLPLLKVSFLFDFFHPMSPELVSGLNVIAPFVTLIHSADDQF